MDKVTSFHLQHALNNTNQSISTKPIFVNQILNWKMKCLTDFVFLSVNMSFDKNDQTVDCVDNTIMVSMARPTAANIAD